MKKIIIIFTISFCFFVLVCPAFAIDQTNLIFSDDISIVDETSVDIPIKILNNTGIMGFSINISYDSTIFSPVSVSKGNILFGMFDDSIGVSEEGNFKVVFSGTEDFTDDGTLFTIRFNVIKHNPTISYINLSYSLEDTFNMDWDDVVLNCENIKVDVGEETSDIFCVSWLVFGEIYKKEYLKTGEKITPPDAPDYDGYEFCGWKNLEKNMPMNDLFIEAVYRDLILVDKPEIENIDLITNRTLDYKTTIIFNVDCDEIYINGVKWYINNKYADTGASFKVENVTDTFEISCAILDDSGNMLSSETYTISVKHDIFSKIVAIFRQIFNKLPIIEL